MLYVVYSLDRADASNIRVGLRKARRAYVVSLGDKARLEGPLLGGDGSEIGTMLVLDVESSEQAHAVAERDPYSEAGLYETTTVRPWRAGLPPRESFPSSRRRVVAPEVREPPPELWSNCLMAGDAVYISGMTARGADWESVESLNAYEQSRVVFGKIRALMEAAGGSMDDIVKLTIFVTDITDREAVWRARKEFFSGDFPACSLIEVSALALPEMKVEIEGIAHVQAG